MFCIDVTLPPALKGQQLVLVAAAAIIDADGRVLISRRPEGKTMAGLWEFPGGKIAERETPESALVRELKEELGIVTSEGCLSPVTFASHAYDGFHLLMPLYLCRNWQGLLAPQEGQNIAWVKPRDLKNYAMPPADAPLLPALLERL